MRNTIFHNPEMKGNLGDIWKQIRMNLVAPFLYIALWACVAMSLMLFVERLYMTAVILCVKVLGKKRSTQYNVELVLQRMEKNGTHPKLLVQIPMYNEREVYKLSIGAACGLLWPRDQIIIQVLDDSTDKAIKKNVMAECKKWQDQGINLMYENRANRNGYKAGALREGLQKQYASDCEHVVIFDADFQPEPDFLKKTVPYLVGNDKLGMVQARWKFAYCIIIFNMSGMVKAIISICFSIFTLTIEYYYLVNADECLMTRLQEMSLNYHFSVEQEVGSTTCQFFGFNGTAGVWRIRAIKDAGGWKERTTVEDMDLAVRASLQGWKFVFVGDVSVKNELPSTFKAYRFQQHRWSCGPANLFKKMTKEIMLCPRVSVWKKIHLVYGFFFVRKIIAHWVTFFFYCVVIPACVLVPEVHLPKALAIYIPATITLLNTGGTPRSLHLLVFWILFENVMSLHRTKAAIIGLLEASRANEWIVTEKLGNTIQNNKSKVSFFKSRFRCGERIHKLELVMGVFMLYCALYNMQYCNDHMFVYLFLQSGAFFTIAFGFVGTFVPSTK